MQILAHNQQIKMAQFRHRPKVTVHSVEGYAKENGLNPNEQVVQTFKLRRETRDSAHCLVWSYKAASVLTADYKGKDEAKAAEDAAYLAAVLIADGQEVQIEGRVFTVRYMGDYSDPVHFEPKQTEAEILAALNAPIPAPIKPKFEAKVFLLKLDFLAVGIRKVVEADGPVRKTLLRAVGKNFKEQDGFLTISTTLQEAIFSLQFDCQKGPASKHETEVAFRAFILGFLEAIN